MIQPRDITNEVKKRPPLQRTAVEENYRDIKVNWKLEFWTANEVHEDINKLKVTATPEKDMYPDISFVIDRNKYPEFNILNQRDFIWVIGEISEVNGLDIGLKNVSVRFKEEENVIPNNLVKNTFIDSQIHFGHGDNIGRDKISKMSPSQKEWYERPLGIIALTLISAGIIYWLGWN